MYINALHDYRKISPHTPQALVFGRVSQRLQLAFYGSFLAWCFLCPRCVWHQGYKEELLLLTFTVINLASFYSNLSTRPISRNMYIDHVTQVLPVMLSLLSCGSMTLDSPLLRLLNSLDENLHKQRYLALCPLGYSALPLQFVLSTNLHDFFFNIEKFGCSLLLWTMHCVLIFALCPFLCRCTSPHRNVVNPTPC